MQQQQEQQLQKQEQQHVAHHRLRSAAPGAARHLSAADVTCPDGCSPGSCFVNDQGTVQCTQCIDTLVVNRTNGQCGERERIEEGCFCQRPSGQNIKAPQPQQRR